MDKDYYFELQEQLEKVKKLTIEYDNAKKIIDSIGKYYGYAHYWDYKIDIELSFNAGYYYRPIFSEVTKFDCKMSSDLLNDEIKKIIKKNIKNIAKDALNNIEKRLNSNRLLVNEMLART